MSRNKPATLADRLRTRLAEFDGKAVSILSEAAVGLGDDAGYLDALIALTADDAPQISVGATWLLKQHLDDGGRLSRPQCRTLVTQCAKLAEWTAVLHMCQSIRYLEVEDADAHGVADWLTPLLAHRRPFLRAWSLDALCHLAQTHRGLGVKARKARENAADDPAASVRARARNLVFVI